MAIVVYVRYLVNGSPFSKCQDTAHSSIQMYVSSSTAGVCCFHVSPLFSIGPRCNGHGSKERDLGSRKVESPEGAEMKNEEGCGGGFARETKEKRSVHREERDMPSDPQEPSAAGVLLCVSVCG